MTTATVHRAAPPGTPRRRRARPVVQRALLEPFAVTTSRFGRFVEETGYITDAERAGGPSWRGRPDHPVVNVSHADALAFCAWWGTRLPTEAEWELAAREAVAVPPSAGTWPVDAFEPNPAGLFCISGNIWEWTAERTLRGGPQADTSLRRVGLRVVSR
jgi:formylglycine-generating enzyme required for sulfatase activity